MASSKKTTREKLLKEIYTKNFDLYKEQKRLEEILLQVDEAVFAVDQSGKISLFNKTAQEIFMVQAKTLINKRLDNKIKLYYADTNGRIDLKKLLKNYTQARLDKINHRYLIVRNKISKQNYYKIGISKIEFDQKHMETVVVMANVTEEVELDHQKDEFISIASHELKTPISIANNSLWMFQNTTKTKFADKELRYLKNLEEGIERMKKIVNNLLDISRIQQGRLVMEIGEHDIYQLMIKSLEPMSMQAKGKKIALNYPQEMKAMAKVDPTRFQEALENLLSNALKYTDTGQIDVKLETLGDKYKISVVDTGPGIEEKDSDRIFTKFGRATQGLKLQKAGASTGLGLYITKEFIEEMGGKIGFETQGGKGSNFWFEVPKA